MKHDNDKNTLYEAALRPTDGPVARFFRFAWLVIGLGALIALAWAEPWSAELFAYLNTVGVPSWLTDFVGLPLVMALRAVLLVEAVGYVYHRFFQHVGFLTRRHYIFRRNQKYHWIHHMIIYPIGRFYRRGEKYFSAEHGLSLSWFAPALGTVIAFVLWHGVTLASVSFIAALGLYIKYVVDLAHSRFHLEKHPWTNSAYFQWLEQIHILHHWDQRKNFTIIHPLMDMLFGTYLSPATHKQELSLAIEDEELTISDLINWRYLLIEATPAEYAAFVSSARKHPRSIRKMNKLLDVLETRMQSCQQDKQAADLHARALALLAACGKPRVC